MKPSSADPAHGASRWATASAIVALAFWCWSGPCFAAGARAIGAMPHLTLSCIVGVTTSTLIHVLRRHRLRDLVLLPGRVAVAGFFGIAVYTVILAIAFGIAADSDLAQVSLINYLWPIWMVLLGFALLGEKPRIALALAGALLGFAGVVVTKGLETFSRPPSSLLPHAMALVGAFLWALYSVLIKRWRVPEEKGGSTLMFFLCGLLAAAVGAVNGEWARIASFNGTALFWILFMGIGPIGIAYYAWEIGIKRGSVHLIAVLAYFVPVVSALLIAWLYRESLSPGLFPGAVMIAAGAFLGKRSVAESESTESG
ncbi:EamA family transporter [Candidatus Sumerlaeota bacterium]|nr:EamA family transporter [Candidatus Sumerlaeota bacterium]